MQNLRLLAVFAVGLWVTASLFAQKNPRETLTEAQQEQIAEAGIDPNARIGLYTKFINERAETIKGLIPRREAGRGRRLDTELQDFSSLIDELGSNLDEYGDRKADLRKALKGLNEAVLRWKGILHDLPNDQAFKISLDAATDSLADLADQTKTLTAQQEEYFKTHVKAKGQEREEPQ